jgi:hypothetical protein
MKFILSLFALALFFAFALADAAKGLTYSNLETGFITTQTEQAAETDLTVAQTPGQEKAGFSL